MSQQPKTETDRLANVIQVLQLGQKTGRLIVERNEGPLFEQGIITFVHGQVVQASVNQQQGPDALNWLRSWGACRFTFTPEQRPTAAGRIAAPTPPLSARRTTGYRSTPGTSPLPTPAGYVSQNNRKFERTQTTYPHGLARHAVPDAPYRGGDAPHRTYGPFAYTSALIFTYRRRAYSQRADTPDGSRS